MLWLGPWMMSLITTWKPLKCLKWYTNVSTMVNKLLSWNQTHLWLWIQMCKFKAKLKEWYLEYSCQHHPRINVRGPRWWQINIGSGDGLRSWGQHTITWTTVMNKLYGVTRPQRLNKNSTRREHEHNSGEFLMAWISLLLMCQAHHGLASSKNARLLGLNFLIYSRRINSPDLCLPGERVISFWITFISIKQEMHSSRQ